MIPNADHVQMIFSLLLTLLSHAVGSFSAGSAADYLAVNPAINKCCACGRANYRMNFRGNWDEKRDIGGKTPFAIDSTSSGYISPRWQALIGASHKESFFLWRYDERAPEHIVQDIENRASSTNMVFQPQETQKHLKENFREVRTVIRMPDVVDAKGFATAQFSVDQDYHLVSFLSFLSPSPDWFVGINSLDMCTRSCQWVDNYVVKLYPIDAGTHTGDQFMSQRRRLSSRIAVQDLRVAQANNRSLPFYEQVANTIPHFATIEFVRTAVRDDQCSTRDQSPFSPRQGDSDSSANAGGGGGQVAGMEVAGGASGADITYREVKPGCWLGEWSGWTSTDCIDCSASAWRSRALKNEGSIQGTIDECEGVALSQYADCTVVDPNCRR